MSWKDYVQAAQGLGFTKVTIINRTNYQTLASSSAADIATAWMDGDVQVNENQELLNDWSDKKRNTFCFYGTKFNIILRSEDDGDFLVCMKGNMVCIAKQLNGIWFIAAGVTKKKGKKKNKDEKEVKGFSGAPDAYNSICKGLLDALEEASI